MRFCDEDFTSLAPIQESNRLWLKTTDYPLKSAHTRSNRLRLVPPSQTARLSLFQRTEERYREPDDDSLELVRLGSHSELGL